MLESCSMPGAASFHESSGMLVGRCRSLHESTTEEPDQAHQQVGVAHAGRKAAGQARVQVLHAGLLQDALLALQPHFAAHRLRSPQPGHKKLSNHVGI